jgi:hypothetical protein
MGRPVGGGVGMEVIDPKKPLKMVHFTCGRTEGGWAWPLGQTHHGLWPIKAKRTPCLVSVHTQSSSLPFLHLSVAVFVSVSVCACLSFSLCVCGGCVLRCVV